MLVVDPQNLLRVNRRIEPGLPGRGDPAAVGPEPGHSMDVQQVLNRDVVRAQIAGAGPARQRQRRSQAVERTSEGERWNLRVSFATGGSRER